MLRQSAATPSSADSLLNVGNLRSEVHDHYHDSYWQTICSTREQKYVHFLSRLQSKRQISWYCLIKISEQKRRKRNCRRLHNKSQEERSWWAVEGSDTIYRCYRTSEYYEYWRYIESFIFLYLFIERSSFIWPTRFLLLHIELCVFSKVQIYKVKLELKPRLMQYNYFIQLNQHFLHGSQKQLPRLAS